MRATRPLLALVVLSMLTGCAWIERSSVSSTPNPVEGNAQSVSPSVSQSGRWVVFSSTASNLVPGDTNGFEDVFVHDHVTGVTERVSVTTDGAQINDASTTPSISDDGRFVAFATYASNFEVPPIARPHTSIVVRDRLLGTSVKADVGGGYRGAGLPAISGNGRFVAYLLDIDFSGFFNGRRVGPFVHDLVNGTTTQMPDGGGLDSSLVFGVAPSLSDDGSRITYSSIVRSSDQEASFATVVADTTTASVVATVDSGVVALVEPLRFESAISGDGTKIVYLHVEGTESTVFRFDLEHPGLVPTLTNVPSPQYVAISDNGRRIAFRRGSEYVVTNAQGSTPQVVSADRFGRPATSVLGNDLSGDGRWVAFASDDPALVPDDTNGVSDVFVRSTRSFKSLVGRGPCPGPARACLRKH